jgi:hypothetical protein
MRNFVGTSGFSYKEWKGSFYPEDLADKQMLQFYAERLVREGTRIVSVHSQGLAEDHAQRAVG